MEELQVNFNQIEKIEYISELKNLNASSGGNTYMAKSYDFLEKILYGTGKDEIDFEYTTIAGTRKFRTPFEGVLPTLDRRYKETKSNGMREFYEMYMSERPCTCCNGARLKKEVLSIKVGKKNINELTDMSIVKVKEYLKS